MTFPHKIFSQHLRNEEVITRVGTFKLDDKGYIVDADERGMKATKEEILDMPAQFRDGEIYQPHGTGEAVLIKTEEQTKQEIQEPEKKPPTAEEVRANQKALIKSLMSTEDLKRNSKGYIDMEPLNKALKEAGLPLLTGAERIAIEDELRAEQPQEDPQTGSSETNSQSEGNQDSGANP